MQKYEELIARLHKIARSKFDTNARAGRRGKEWAIEAEPEFQAAEAITALCGELEEANRKKISIETDDGTIIIRVLGTSITICAETAVVFNAELWFPAKTVLLGTDLSDIVEEYSDAILAKHKEKNDG